MTDAGDAAGAAMGIMGAGLTLVAAAKVIDIAGNSMKNVAKGKRTKFKMPKITLGKPEKDANVKKATKKRSPKISLPKIKFSNKLF